MALAETASIFCETLVVEEGLGRLDGRERLALLDVDLQGANQVVVDIRSRFLFETAVFAARQRRTLGVEQLNDLMLAAQAEAYGDGLDQSTAHPYMWAVKPHYYGAHFYNWPYTYGLLFGLGLFARYRDDPERVPLALRRRAVALRDVDRRGAGCRLRLRRHRPRRSGRRASTCCAGASPSTNASPTSSDTRYDPDRDALAALLDGEPRYRVDQVWRGLYEQLATPAEMTNLPKALRARLDAELPPALTEVTRRVNDGGDTVKQLWALAGGGRDRDGADALPRPRHGLRVAARPAAPWAAGSAPPGRPGSSATSPSARSSSRSCGRPRGAHDAAGGSANVVFMGMGEPLANEADVWAAVERIHGDARACPPAT